MTGVWEDEELWRGDWQERLHPRDRKGRFAHSLGTPAAKATKAATGRTTPGGFSEDYVPPVRDRWIPDLKPAAGVKDLTSAGRPSPPATGEADDPIDVGGDLNKALHLMHAGKHVRLNQPDEVALLLDRVRELSAKAAEGGKQPTWDFGLLTVRGTNLFTAQSRGIPRIGMPQFSGLAQPGSQAARLAGGAGKFVDLGPQFAAALRRDGVRVRRAAVKASHLRATQTELDGAKVAGIADAARHGNKGAADALKEPIFVTRDHYVIDGHHRWAANMMLDALDGKLGNDVTQQVTEIDMDIGAAIPYALEFANRMGIGNRGLSRAAGLDWDPAEYLLTRAAAGGRHVPGTGTEWRHGWEPLSLDAAKSHYHNRVPPYWHPPGQDHPDRTSGVMKHGDWLQGHQAVSPAPVHMLGGGNQRQVSVPGQPGKHTVRGSYSDPWWMTKPGGGWAVSQRWRHKAQTGYDYQGGKSRSFPIPAGDERVLTRVDATGNPLPGQDAYPGGDREFPALHVATTDAAAKSRLSGQPHYITRPFSGNKWVVTSNPPMFSDFFAVDKDGNWSRKDASRPGRYGRKPMTGPPSEADFLGASRAAAGGHHVPGSGYDWQHEWHPLTYGAAQSHFHGHTPPGWQHGQASADPRKGTKIIVTVSKNSRHPRAQALWRVSAADAHKIVNDRRTSLRKSALFAYDNDQLPPEKRGSGPTQQGSRNTWDYIPDNGMWDDLLAEHGVTKLEHHGNLLPMPGEATYRHGQPVPAEFTKAAAAVAHDSAASGPDEVLKMTPPYHREAVSAWEKRARQDWDALEYSGAASRSGHWRHEWIPLDFAAAGEKFHHHVPAGWQPGEIRGHHGSGGGAGGTVRGVKTATKAPDLSALPPEPKVPPRESVSSWSKKSMTDYLHAGASHQAWQHAANAGKLQKAGAGHQKIMEALGAAESAAPEDERAFHAARLDAYAQAHGLKGWYRHAGPHGEHMVQVNKLRTPAEGNKGRYYALPPTSVASSQATPIIDRDTGKVVATVPPTKSGHFFGPDTKAAREWIAKAEQAPATPEVGTHVRVTGGYHKGQEGHVAALDGKNATIEDAKGNRRLTAASLLEPTGKPAKTMAAPRPPDKPLEAADIKPDMLVATAGGIGKVMRPQKGPHGIPGAVVQFPVRDLGEGSMPHWVPLDLLHAAPPGAKMPESRLPKAQQFGPGEHFAGGKPPASPPAGEPSRWGPGAKAATSWGMSTQAHWGQPKGAKTAGLMEQAVTAAAGRRWPQAHRLLDQADAAEAHEGVGAGSGSRAVIDSARQSFERTAAGQANARAMDHNMALTHAQMTHFHDATGLTLPHSADMKIRSSPAEYSKAMAALGRGDYAEGLSQLDQAIAAEREGRNAGTAAKLEAFRAKVAKATANPKQPLPPLAIVGRRAGGALHVIDHAGREYRVRLTGKPGSNRGTVEVSHGGKTLTGPASSNAEATTVARRLAAQLTGMTAAQAAKAERVTPPPLSRAGWDPARHPRDRRGEFAHTGEAAATEIRDTQAIHKVGGSYTPQRAELHKKIIAGVMAGHSGGHGRPKATFLGGGPAAGKSTVMPKASGAVLIDPDAIKEQLPEYRQMIAAKHPGAAAHVHEESSDIAHQLRDAVQSGHYDFTLDGTGDTDYAKMAAKIDAARAAGYQTHGAYVTIPTDEAVRRAKERAKQTGRMVPETVIRAVHASVSDVLPRLLADNKLDSMDLWDNSGPKPVLIAQKLPGKTLVISDHKAWDAFLAKAKEPPHGAR